MNFFRILCQGWRVALLGGNVYDSNRAGVFFLRVDYDLAHAHPSISGRLSY